MKLIKAGILKRFNYFKNLIKADMPVHNLSLSIALGIFIGLAVPVGFQTFLIIPAALLLRCNVTVAWAATYISNPVTIFPIYIVAAFIGERLTSFKVSLVKINYFISHPSANSLLGVGPNTFMAVLAGSLIMGIILSIAVYYFSFFLITRQREKSKQSA